MLCYVGVLGCLFQSLCISKNECYRFMHNIFPRFAVGIHFMKTRINDSCFILLTECKPSNIIRMIDHDYSLLNNVLHK